jgi:hypothetical protein
MTTKTQTPEPITHRVVVPMIQILGHVPFSGKHQVYDRTLRHGDVLPAWVPAAELDRLLAIGAIKVAD